MDKDRDSDRDKDLHSTLQHWSHDVRFDILSCTYVHRTGHCLELD